MTTSAIDDMASEQAIYVFPTSFAQEGLWFLDQLEPASAAYNIPVAVRLRRQLDLDALHRSLNAIVQRHEVLRTTFRMIEGQLMQVVATTVNIPLPVVDLQGLHGAKREAEALRLATAEARHPFDLTHGPLVRATVLQLGAEENMLLLTLHHIIFDGWSEGVLFRELASLYEAFSIGLPSSLPELPIQFADFAVWQREALQGDILAEHLAFWKLQLAGIPAELSLPTDRPHLPLSSSRGSTYGFMLPKELSNALKDLSRKQGVTLYMTLVAAFQTLLFRYSGQDDVVIGTVGAGRSQSETETLIGFFVNTLVLRTDLSGNPTFSELLGRVREVILGAQFHQDLPFESLVKELQPERQLGQNPLFQVSLTLEPPLPILPSEWTQINMEDETGTSKFDLSLQLDDRPDGLLGRFEYSTDLFDQATIARMAEHWQTLLKGVVDDPAQHIATLPLLTEAERQQLLVDWNSSYVEYQKGRCIHRLFEEQVERTPEAIAVVFEGEQLTYWELNVRANQLAHHLRRLGVGPDVLVGLCVERSLDMVVGLLGILKAGGAYVPLDPAFPAERLAFMLEDTHAPVLVTQHRLIGQLPERYPQLVCLDTDWQTISQRSWANPVDEVKGEQLAYVIYTSGSTGQPKGVLIEHHALAAHCWTIAQVYELQAEDCVLQFSTFTFDASLEQILPTLMVGARLVVRGQEIWTPADLLHQVKNLGLTVINLPPAYWHHVLHEWVQIPSQLQGHRLRLVIVGGDRLLPEMLQLWQQTPLKSVRLLNAYGPTETTVTATIFDIKIDREQLVKKVPIGRPLPNRKAYILDKVGNLQPVGVAGELYIGGDLLARGYLNCPELTRERFITDLFSHQPQARLYKTGDLVRYLPDGTIEFLGRVDQQVKIRGFRIELGEIEAVLRQHPAMHQVVVITREDEHGDKRLVAYFVLHEDQTARVDDLKNYASKRLPAYMVPSAFILVEALPLMSNGKVDLRALPAPEPEGLTAKDKFVAPFLPLHHQLVQIWEDLLGVRPIGIKEDFFDLGGHSLLAARLFDRIVQVCGKKLPLSTLFAGATIEHLVTALMGGAKTDFQGPLIALQVDGSRRPFFYLHGQWEEGLSLHCYPLARALGSDQPLYALEPYPLDGQQRLPTLEDIAAAHVKVMRAIQPEGPYLLGGWCNGGLVAYEMARQLRTEGHAIDLLVLMDPTPLLYPINYRLYRVAIDLLGKLLRVSRVKQQDWYLCLRYVLRYLHYKLLRREDPEHLTFRDLRQNYPRLYDWIASGYRPLTLYDGKVTFFWTQESYETQAILKGWRKIEANGEIEIHVVPGDHLTIKTDYLPVLADHLDSCIRKAQGSAPESSQGEEQPYS